MWLNEQNIKASALADYRASLLGSCPHYVVIDNLFNTAKLDEIMPILQQTQGWQTQQHTYSALYVDSAQWQNTPSEQRFVQRDAWHRDTLCASSNIAEAFLCFLRSDEFMAVLSRIFKVQITDINVAKPSINSNYFRLGATDFVEQHADDSPGREVCMLLYLNQGWSGNEGGELTFSGKNDTPTSIAPLYNRCVLFDPSSLGSEHWVERLKSEHGEQYRYNVTSWYWSE